MSFIDVLKVAIPVATAVIGESDTKISNPLKQENPYLSALKEGIKVLDTITQECDAERSIPTQQQMPQPTQVVYHKPMQISVPAMNTYPVQNNTYTSQFTSNVSGQNKQYAWDMENGYHQRLK